MLQVTLVSDYQNHKCSGTTLSVHGRAVQIMPSALSILENKLQTLSSLIDVKRQKKKRLRGQSWRLKGGGALHLDRKQRGEKSRS